MPEWKPEIARCLAPLNLAPARKAEIAEELAQHLEDRYQELIASGKTDDQAFRTTIEELKDDDLLARSLKSVVKEKYREPIVQGDATRSFFAGVVQDARFALRMLRKSPGFTAAAVLTLTLGIGANTAIFSVVNVVLVRPLPYPHPEQLFNMWRTQRQGWTGAVSIPDLRDWQTQNTTLQGIAAFSTTRFNLRGKSEPETADGACVSPNFFDVMQVPFFVGRGFEPGEQTPGFEHVVVLSYELWVNQFGGNRALVGHDIRLNGEDYTVVGIMPRGFHYPRPTSALWVPLVPRPEQLERSAHDFLTIARLKPGVSLEQASTELNAIGARLAKAYPVTDTGLGAFLVPLRLATVGRIQQSLLVVFGIVGVIFLIACVNVSNFLLSRAKTRQREMAVRTALGAKRSRLLAQFFVEVLLLSLGGALLAALTARWSIAALIALGGNYLPDPRQIHPDARVFGFTLGLAFLAAVLVSLVAAWSATRVNVYETLKESAQYAGTSRRQLNGQSVLVVVQIATAFLLLIGAGAMIKCLMKLSRIDPGFHADHLLTLRIPFPEKQYNENHPLTLFIRPAVAKLEALPGVQGSAVITYLPLQSAWTNSTFRIEGKPAPRPNEEPSAETRAISPDYFRTMGIRLLRGRWFTDADSADAPEVAIVNRTFVKQFFSNEDALGKRIDFTDEGHWASIVGVVEDSRQIELEADPLAEVDMPFSQTHWTALISTMTMVVKTTGDPTALSKTIEQTIYSVDPDQGVYGVRTMEDIIAATEGDQRFMMWLLDLFAALTLTLAATGVFGQASYTVAQRTREIGVRMALGARRSDVVCMVLGQSATVALAGMLVGFAGSYGLMKLLASFLYEVKPGDPFIVAGAGAVLVILVLAACYLPARRAMHVDPMVALRYE
jgi:putative ABC transport system permease protein